MAAGGEAVNEEIADSTRMGGSLDELIQYVTLYVRKPVFLSGLVLPFVPLYLFVFYLWIFVYGLEEFHYKGLIAIITIALVHLLTILWCFWSAHVVAFINCQRVKAPAVNAFAKVVPTVNNGSPRMVRIERSEFFDGTEQFYFLFRRSQYIWDDDTSIFRRNLLSANEMLQNYSPRHNLEPEEVVALA